MSNQVISFERDGSTIYYKLNLNFVQAALGDSVEVPTVHGDVELNIPEGTQTGKRFRLRGKELRVFVVEAWGISM